MQEGSAGYICVCLSQLHQAMSLSFILSFDLVQNLFVKMNFSNYRFTRAFAAV